MPSVNGVPSVTEILRAVGLQKDYGFLSNRDRSEATLRGKALHLAIQCHHEWARTGDKVDLDSLRPEIRYGFDAYCDFVEQEQLEWRHSELELFHPSWNYVGHLDLVLAVPDVGIEVVDLKHTDSVELDDAALQLAGYGLLWDASYPDHVRRRVLQIPRSKGVVKPHDVTDAHAAEVFKAALVVYHAKQRRA